MIILKKHNSYLALFLPALIIIAMFGFVRTELFAAHSDTYTLAVLFDLLIAVPLLYAFVSKKLGVAPISTFKLFTICLLILTLLIPNSDLSIVLLIQQIVYPLIKIWITFKVLQKIWQLIKEYKVNSIELNAYSLYSRTISNVFKGRFGEILIMEFSVLYFLFASKDNERLAQNEFTYAKNKGTVEVVSAFIFIILIESIVAHYFIAQWNIVVAFIASYSSLYLIMLFVSILRSRSHFPIRIENDILLLQYGFVNKSIVNIRAISKVEKTSRSNDESIMKLSAFKGVERHNIILHFYDTQQITKVFGIKKDYSSIGIFVDDQEAFCACLNKAISNLHSS